MTRLMGSLLSADQKPAETHVETVETTATSDRERKPFLSASYKPGGGRPQRACIICPPAISCQLSKTGKEI